MAALKPIPNSDLYQAFVPSSDIKTRFCFYTAQPPAPGSNIDLGAAWTRGGVFVVADGKEDLAELSRFTKDLWQASGGGSAKVVAWIRGVQAEPLYLIFDSAGNYVKGKFGSALMDQSIGSVKGQSISLMWRPISNLFSANVDSPGSAIRFICNTNKPTPFECLLDGEDIPIDLAPLSGGKAEFGRIVVSDQEEGSGAWSFAVTAAKTAFFLEQVKPMVNIVEWGPRASDFPCFDIEASKGELAKTGLAVKIHPYSVHETHTAVAFAKAQIPLVSRLLDSSGRPVGLTTTTDSQFRLLPNPRGSGPEAHVCPAGTFKVQFAATTQTEVDSRMAPAMEILAGTAGTEFVLFGDGNTSLPDAIAFVPDRPAFVQVASNGVNKLTKDAVTAWLRPAWTGAVRASQGNFQYVSQPEEAPFFGVKTVAHGKNVLTGLAETPGMKFDPAPRTVSATDQSQGALPWLPLYDASAAKLNAARRLDKTVLVPNRARIATDARPPAARLSRSSGQTRWVVMPQGYTVEIDEQSQWLQVVFGVSSGGLSVQFSLQRPMERGHYVERWPIQESLSRSATFLVATRFPKSMPGQGQPVGNVPVEFSATINGWSVQVKMGDATSPSAFATDRKPPILVVKLGNGSVVDLLKVPENWSLPQILNEDVARTKTDLEAAVDGMRSLKDGKTPLFPGGKPITLQAKEEYARLYEKLAQPDWNGVILFNAYSSLDNLPGEVAALRGGVPEGKNELWVPCVGLDLCKIGEAQLPPSSPGNSLPPKQSPSAFAGIHYFDIDELDPSPLSFALKLKNLDVVLHNSSLRVFIAKADLRVSALLGAKTEDKENGNAKNRLIRIEGSYQGRTAESGDRYVIRALGKQRIKMESSDLIEEIQLDRLELTSKKEQGNVLGRFGMWGSVTFGKTVTDIAGAKSVGFENLAVSMTLPSGGSPSFKLDAGHIAVTWDTSESVSGPSWLKKFPIRLSGLRWGGANLSSSDHDVDWPNFGKFPRLELPDVGFTRFDLGDLVSDKLGTGFDFGLEFDLDMGGLGSWSDVSKLLRGKVLIGWYDFRRNIDGNFKLPWFSVGFKFEGGSTPLDIGLQGVFRLKAKRVILKKYDRDQDQLLGIGLVEPQLDILGYTIPEKPERLTMAAVVALGAKSGNNLPTWILALKGSESDPIEAGPVALDYFAIGQNAYLVDPAKVGDIKNVTDAIEQSIEWVRDKFKNDQLVSFRPPSPTGKWNLIASGQIRDDVAKVKFAFLDDIPLYGLRVQVPQQSPWIVLDILYKKIDEELGVFSIEIDPKGLRTIELGAGSVTLPVFGFDKFTNGDWSYNFGFNGNDFSKAGSAQFLPFIGSASLRLGQLSGLSGNFLLAGADTRLRERYRNLQLRPVYEMQVAFRFGIGKEIREGVFSAGASLTVYGIFQGAVATINQANHPNRHGQYLKFAGAAGILLEIFGKVDFAIVSAAVCVRAWVETGLIAETWEEIAIYAEAGVSVYVRFVIARFSVFGHTVEIAIHFSFSITLRIGATLPYRLGGNEPQPLPAETYPYLNAAAVESQPEPIDWSSDTVVSRTLVIPLLVSMDLAVNDSGKPVLLPMLAFVNPTPQGLRPLTEGDSIRDLVLALFRWTVRRSMNLEGVDPHEISSADLKSIAARLRAPSGRSASRWRMATAQNGATKALEADVIRDFLSDNVSFQVGSPANFKEVLRASMRADAADKSLAEPVPGILMPWLRELQIFSDPSNRLIRDFADPSFEKVDEKWEQRLEELLRKGRPDFDDLDDSRTRARLAAALEPTPELPKKTVVDVLLEDWTAALIEGSVYAAREIMRAEKLEKIDFQSLLEKLDASDRKKTAKAPALVEVAQHASAILMHALRVPMVDSQTCTSLMAFAALDLDWARAGIGDRDRGIEVRASGASWISGAVRIQFSTTDAGEARKRAEQAAAEIVKSPPEVTISLENKSKPFVATFSHGIPIFAGDAPNRMGYAFETPGEVSELQAKLQLPYDPPDRKIQISYHSVAAFDRLEEQIPDKRKGPRAIESAIYLGGQFKLKIRRLSSQENTSSEIKPIQGVYGISGAGETGRLILQSWRDKLKDLAPEGFALLLNPSAGSIPEAENSTTQLGLIEHGIQFFVTNLSTEANPDQARLLTAADPGVVMNLDNADEVRDFLWKASVVNGEGFYLRVDASNPNAVSRLEAVLGNNDVADIAIMWTRPAFKTGKGAPKDTFLHPNETWLIVRDASIPADVSIRIGIVEWDRKATAVPDGFVSLLVKRPNPLFNNPSPTDAAYLMSKYAYLDYRIDPSADPGRLVGLEFDECTPLPVRAPENDLTKALAEQDQPEIFEFQVLLPLCQFAKQNRPGGSLLLDPDERNPFALFGLPLDQVLSFGLRDGAGHRFPGAISTTFLPNTLQLYTDPMHALETYAGMSLGWSAIPSGGKARVEVRLKWLIEQGDWDKYPVARRQKCIALFRRLKWTLEAFGVSATASLSANGGLIAPELDVLQPLIKLAGDIVVQLTSGQLKKIDLGFTFDCSSDALKNALSTTSAPVPFDVAVTVTRPDAFCNADLVNKDESIQKVRTQILPTIEKNDRNAWTVFANQFEEAFSPSPGAASVRAVRPATGNSKGVVWVIPTPVLDAAAASPKRIWSFAPKPLSKEFRSGEAKLLDSDGFNPPTTIYKPVSDIDMDALAQRAFDTIESLLLPDISAKICQLSQDSFKKIMSSKATIAEAYTDRLAAIEAAQGGKPADVAVRKRFKNAALKDLRRIYQLGAICSIQPAVRSPARSADDIRIYGDVGVVGNTRNVANVEFAKLRLPLDNALEAAISVFWKGDRHPDAVEGDVLQISPEYLEWPWEGSYGPFIPSRWFELMSDAARRPAAVNLKGSRMVIPLPLRFLPKPPHMYGHEGKEATSQPATLTEARKWGYALDVAVPPEEQDRVTFQVTYDAPGVTFKLGDAARSLFDCLVTFEHYTNSIIGMISTVRAWTIGSEQDVARQKCESLARFIEDLAYGFANFKAPAKMRATAEDKSDAFEATISELNSGSSGLSLASVKDRRRLDFRCIRASIGTTDREASVQLSDVTRTADGKPGSVGATTLRTIRDPAPNKAGYADYDDQAAAVKGLGELSGRRLSISRLDIFVNPAAAPTVSATRNEMLGGVLIAEAFKFTTAKVTLERLVPRLHATARIPLDKNTRPLAEHLAAIAQELFAGADQRLSVDAVATLKVPFSASNPQVFSYPLGAMKGVTAGQLGEWVNVFKAWAVRIETELASKKSSNPSGISIAVSVYAEGYAGGRPVLVVDDIWLPWNRIVLSIPSVIVGMPNFHRPEAIAAAIFELTRGILPLKGKSTKASVAALRERIATLIGTGARSLNLLDTRYLPSAAELASPRLREIWLQCLSLANKSLAKEEDHEESIPIAWALAPVDPANLTALTTSAVQASPYLGAAFPELEVICESEPFFLERVSERDVFSGDVALFALREKVAAIAVADEDRDN